MAHLFALTPVAAASTAGVLGLVGVWLAFNANGLTENQNRLIESQSTLMQIQTDLMTEQNRQILRQNELLLLQNKAISIQTELSESSRRAAIHAELVELLALVTEFIKAQPKIDGSSTVRKWMLPDVYYSRIVSILRDMRPYRYVNRDLVKTVGWEVWYPSGSHTHVMRTHIGPLSKPEMTEPELNDRALSPERGQLLYTLVLMHVDLDPLRNGEAIFADSDLSFTNLTSADLSLLTLDGSVFWFSDLSSAILSDASLQRCDFRYANLSKAKVDHADFGFADLRATQLTELDLRHCSFSASNVRHACIDHIEFDKASKYGFLFGSEEETGLREAMFEVVTETIDGEERYFWNRLPDVPGNVEIEMVLKATSGRH